jgi:hypothetical protein
MRPVSVDPGDNPTPPAAEGPAGPGALESPPAAAATPGVRSAVWDCLTAAGHDLPALAEAARRLHLPHTGDLSPSAPSLPALAALAAHQCPEPGADAPDNPDTADSAPKAPLRPADGPTEEAS